MGDTIVREPEWLAMLYVNAADSEIYKVAQQYLVDIGSAAAVVEGSVCVWVQWRFKDSKTNRFVVERFKLPKFGELQAWDRKPIADDFASAEGIGNFLSDCRNQCPNAKTLVVFHSHGSGALGLGWMTKFTSFIDFMKQSFDVEVDDRWGLISFEKRISAGEGEKMSPGLTLFQIGEGLKRGSSGSIIDIVMFSACFMALLETVYQLRESCRFLLASEDIGYSTLTGNVIGQIVGKNPLKCSQLLVKNYETMRAAEKNAPLTFSAIDMGNAHHVFKAIQKLSDEVFKLPAQELNLAILALRLARLEAGTLGGPGANQQTTDLVRLLERFAAHSSNKVICDCALEAIGSVSGCVAARAASEGDATAHGAHGIAIYCPAIWAPGRLPK